MTGSAIDQRVRTPGLQSNAPPECFRGQYEETGHLILRRVFQPQEIRQASDEANGLLGRLDLIHTNNLRCRWQTDVRNGDCVFECFDPVVDLSPACASIAMHSRLLAILGEIQGEEACLFKDKLIFKPPGAKGYGLHQDYIAWPSFPRSFLTVLIPLDDADQMNGCTEVFTGYHKSGTLSIEDGEYHELPLELVDSARAVPMELAVGDIGIFGAFTPHRSAPNLSGGYRRQLYLSYNALSDGGQQRERHYTEFLAWLRKKYAEYGKTEVWFR